MSKQKIYSFYVNSGMTHEGALACMGNGDCESNLVSYRKQGDFSDGYRISREYTAAIDNGSISRAQFCNGLTGYGLYQWTYQPRQEWLYDAAKREGCSIGDLDFQLRFSLWELKNHFPGVWMTLTTSHDLYACTDIVCRIYENPAVKNTGDRFNAAKRIEQELQEKPAPAPVPVPSQETYWPPRMVDKGMSGPDVACLQAILKARGYEINYISGKFDDLLEKEAKRFQSANGLAADGVFGPLSWAALVRMGR